MTDLLNLIIYIFSKYPNISELSKPRLVKLIYLIDWKHTIDNDKQATCIKWYFNHYGPYVDDVINLIKQNPSMFKVGTSINIYGGGITDKIEMKFDGNVTLDQNIIKSADFIIENTSKMNWSEFINLVYSTYPIKNNSRYKDLNLVEEARKFKESK